MKRTIYLLLFSLILISESRAQLVVFSDDFEAGLTNWDVTGLWGTTTTDAYSPTHSFTDSPDGNYPDMLTSEATMNVNADLSGALDADVQFYGMVDLEEGFDYVYLDVSTDAGVSWTEVTSFNGEDMFTWTLFNVPLGAFVGSPEVRIRFRFVSDAAYNKDGIYIDDLVMHTYNIDASPPLIIHTPTNLYEGTLGDNPLSADILDASGLSSVNLYYSVDGGAYASVPGINTFGDTYLFNVPAQDPGAWVDYYIQAVDGFFPPNTATTEIYQYIAGNYISYDAGAIDYVADIGTTSLTGYVSAAVKVTLTGTTNLVTAIIQNYTDYMRPNDNIQFHVWADNAGLPGADLIPPFYVTPEPTLAVPNKGTRVDLRGMPSLEGIMGDVYVGYTVPGGLAWLSYTNTLLVNRSYVQTGFGWSEFFGDFHFRVVTDSIQGAPVAYYSHVDAATPTIAFTDLSTNSPTSWYWDFNDGTTSTLENPSHTYLSNGDYNVCLTATNAVASDTYCEIITIDTYVTPVADFSYAGDPNVTFTDLSINSPTSWAWDFGDGATSPLQNPSHIYADDGAYTVCLTSTNAAGSDNVCKTVNISNTPKVPDVDFSWSISGTTVTFTDLSTNTPTYWTWDFGDGGNATIQNPSHFYPAPASYTVCLTAGNAAGENIQCKVLDFNAIDDLAAAWGLTLQPNPAQDIVQLTINETDLNGVTCSVLDPTGRVISTVNMLSSLSLDVHALPAGIYFIKVTDGNRSAMMPFVKQ